MRDGGEYLDSLSKALIPQKNFKMWGDLPGRRNKRERGRISGDFEDYWEVVGGGRARVGFTLPGRYSAGEQGVTLSSIAPATGALPNRGTHKRNSKKSPPSLARATSFRGGPYSRAARPARRAHRAEKGRLHGSASICVC
jgi:hypothetical protein